MPKRTLAALLALLVAASTLAVVAQPAAAHSQTTTKQRCSYDPFAGRQCWTETVTVAHTHSCGAGMTGTHPNCYPIPPANQNCGAGMTGTHPNCYPIPSDNKKTGDNGGDDDDGGGGTDDDTDDSGGGTDTDDTDDDTDDSDDSDDEGGVGPSTVTCTGGYHRFGNGCHTHGFTPPADQCGTGKTWAPHAGHTPIRLPACKTTTTADPCGDYAENLIAALNKAGDGTNTKPTLPTRPDACKGSDWIDSVKSKLAGLSDAAVSKLIAALKALNDAPDSHDLAVKLGHELADLWDEAPVEAKAAIAASAAGVGCIALVVAIGKTTLTTVGTAAPAWVAWIASSSGKATVKATCSAAFHAAGTAVYLIAGQNDDDDPSDEKNVNNAKDQDGDGTDGSYDPDTDGDGKISTAEWNEVVKKNDAGDVTDAQRKRIEAQWKCDIGLRSSCQDTDDSDDSDGTDDPPTLDDVREAEEKWRRGGEGEITKDELTRIQNEYDCAQGWADACAALGR